MRPVSLTYEFQYTECDLAARFAETLPTVKLYFDRHFQRSRVNGGIVDILLDEDDLNKTYGGTLTAHVHRRMGDIPPTSSIGFASFALRRNQWGNLAYVDAGTSDIHLGEIQEALDMGKPFERELELVLHTAKEIGTTDPGVEKGKLLVRITSLDMGQVGFSTGPTPLEASVEELDDALVTYIKSTMDQQSVLKDTINGTDRIHAPMDVSGERMCVCSGGA
jgi:hypothetical protein